MSYVYAEQRPYVFTEEGQATFLKVRDRAKLLLEESGAATWGGADDRAAVAPAHAEPQLGCSAP